MCAGARAGAAGERRRDRGLGASGGRGWGLVRHELVGPGVRRDGGALRRGGPHLAARSAHGQQGGRGGVTLAASPRFLVARTALLYGLAGGRKGCFTDAILARLRAGEAVPLFEDQHRTPLLVTDAARALVDLTARRPGGILHLAGPQRVSRLEHGLALARAFDLDLSLCRPTRVAELPGLAPRPADTSLRIDRLVALLGWSPLDVAAGCARLAEGA